MLVWFGYGFGMVVLWCWYGFDMFSYGFDIVSVWCWYGVYMVLVCFGMVVLLFWYGFGMVLVCFGMVLIWFSLCVLECVFVWLWHVFCTTMFLLTCGRIYFYYNVIITFL